MKIFYHNHFFKRLIDLPKKIQKGTLASIEQFRKDKFANSLNFEKLPGMKDKRMRSIRVSDKYRIIFNESEEGNEVYHFLWVDNHDEAYAWAKNKVFEWNRLTQSFQIFVAEEESNPSVVETQKETPEKTFMQAFNQADLLKIGIPEMLLPSVLKLDDLDGLQRMEKYLPEDVFENLFYLFDGIDIREIIHDIEDGLVNENALTDQLLSANNQRNFLLETEDELLKNILEGDFQAWKIFLHPSQRKLVERNFSGPVKVTGGAGTGKTVAAIHRIKWLTENTASKKAKPIFFTTYTKSLIDHLKADLQSLNVNLNKVEVNNLDAYVVNKVKDLELVKGQIKVLDFLGQEEQLRLWEEVIERELSPFSSEFLRDEYREVILYHALKEEKQYLRTTRVGRPERLGRVQRKTIWSLMQTYESIKKEQGYFEKGELYNRLADHFKETENHPFDHVLCDEIQDFSSIELRLLRSMVPEQENDLFLVGDPFQSIYTRRVNFSKVGIHIRGRRSRRLKVNYRTTEEIKRAAVSAIKGVSYHSFDEETVESVKGYVSLLHGIKPSYNTYKTETDEFKALEEILKEHAQSEEGKPGLPYNEICIAARDKKSLNAILKALHQKNYPYYQLIAGNKKGDIKNGIRLSTFHNLKGLEFKVIILVGVNDRTLPYLPKDHTSWDAYQMKLHVKKERALAYVAMTRAVQCLYILGVGKRSGLIEL